MIFRTNDTLRALVAFVLSFTVACGSPASRVLDEPTNTNDADAEAAAGERYALELAILDGVPMSCDESEDASCPVGEETLTTATPPATEPGTEPTTPVTPVEPEKPVALELTDPVVDIATDVTLLIDDALVTEVNAAECTTARTPFFTGIQALDNDAPNGNYVGDAGSANVYQRYARRSLTDPAAARQVTDWHVLHYYNQPTQAGRVATILTNARGSVKSTYRTNRATLARERLPNRTGEYTTSGDRMEVRLLGLWSMMAGNAFKTHAPEFQGPNAARDRADFLKYWRDVVNTQAWREFIRDAVGQTALAFKCGKPVYAHSGGGAVLGFVLRLMAERGGFDLATWRADGKFVAVGLEAVLSTQARDALLAYPAYQGKLEMVNYVARMTATAVDTNGSPTWRDPILVEMGHIGQTALITSSVWVQAATRAELDEAARQAVIAAQAQQASDEGAYLRALNLRGQFSIETVVDGNNEVAGGHAGVGMHVLRYGMLPGITFPAP